MSVLKKDSFIEPVWIVLVNAVMVRDEGDWRRSKPLTGLPAKFASFAYICPAAKPNALGQLWDRFCGYRINAGRNHDLPALPRPGGSPVPTHLIR